MNIKQRVKKLEIESGKNRVCYVVAHSPGGSFGPTRTLTEEEWVAKHCVEDRK